MVEKEFYDFIFGKINEKRQVDELSMYIAEKVDRLLISPSAILESLPILPVSLTQVISQIRDDNFNTEKVILQLEQEPVIAAKVVELANSSYYNRSDKEVTDIKAAFMRLGVNGLSEGVINGFMSRLVPQKDLYFKFYGQKIWEHSLLTGIITKKLLSMSEHKELAAQGYLTGLIVNLGDVIIYQLMLEAFTTVHPDHQPNSSIFKDLINKNSKKLTYFVAKHWNLPKTITDTLALQLKIGQSIKLSSLFSRAPLASYIYEAKILSSLEIRLNYKDISIEEYQRLTALLLHSNEAKRYSESLSVEVD